MSADHLDGGVGAVAEADEGVGEGGVGVHRDVAGDVVEDVRPGCERRLAVADGDRGRELAAAQAVEEQKCRHEAADAGRVEARQRSQETVDVFQTRDAVGVQAQRVQPPQEVLVGVAVPARLHARVQPPPGGVVVLRIKLVGLVDELPPRAPGAFDKGRFARRQSCRLRPARGIIFLLLPSVHLLRPL